MVLLSNIDKLFVIRLQPKGAIKRKFRTVLTPGSYDLQLSKLSSGVIIKLVSPKKVEQQILSSFPTFVSEYRALT